MYGRFEGEKLVELVGNIVFSDTVYQTPESLTPEQRAEFGVYEIVDIFPPLSENEVYAEAWTYEIDGASVRRTWVVRNLTPEEITERYKASIPQVVTIRQARLALLQAGLLDDIDAAIAASTDRALKIEWEFATEFRRDWPALLAMQPALGLMDQQVDDLFVLAATL